jgi:hypothetical protein
MRASEINTKNRNLDSERKLSTSPSISRNGVLSKCLIMMLVVFQCTTILATNLTMGCEGGDDSRVAGLSPNMMAGSGEGGERFWS